MTTSPVLPALPDSVTISEVPVADGVSLRVLRAGSGTPLVMLPGWTCSADFFVHQLTGLSDRFDVIAIDPRGHGGSSKPLTGNTFAQRGNDLAALVDALGLDRFVLLGWSFGVLDALSYIRSHGTDRIEKLVIVDETPKVPADPADASEWGEAPLTHDGIVGLQRAVLDDRVGFWTAYASYMIGSENADDVARIVELGLQTPEHIAVASVMDGATSDYSAEAASASAAVPTLFLAREDWADDARTWVTAHMPQAQFDTIPLHMGFATHPEDFNAKVREFAATNV
ncbi:alpha/beta fold hydrolase [Microbacterium keratanolyticum]|uniref:alpha/beta fold hydrolase n=1 Tax=Microbacterium keratanolyticum TaxID=67574 RepID=UPI00362BB557